MEFCYPPYGLETRDEVRVQVDVPGVLALFEVEPRDAANSASRVGVGPPV